MDCPELRFELKRAIKDIPAEDWDRIANHQNPFFCHAFLNALEVSQSVNAKSGWQPVHLAVYQMDRLIGIAPMYLKSHSYGEYVFDFSWANAYHQHGLDYYPKLVNAIPFTPVTGIRLFLDPEFDSDENYEKIFDFLLFEAEALGVSSLHCLFPPYAQSRQLIKYGGLQRRAVQFQWMNNHYQDFTDYLSYFTARRRKSVRKEREKVQRQGINVKRLSGQDLTKADMALFYQCYMKTYLKRSGHTGYLNHAFFDSLYDTMADSLLLVVAQRDDVPLACALYLFDDNQLCGRYWGALEDADGLHFECCYYQGIEFCIEHNIPSFNPGTQGEHKILRGFEPVFTYSNHWILREDFRGAISDFLNKESFAIERYKAETETLLPFKRGN